MSATKQRGKNWSIEEDEALCFAWINTSQDASIGINQRMEAMYSRVYETFLEICSEKQVPANPELRAPSGIKARWHHISKTVSKFAGCLAQIDGRCQSGTSPEDEVKQAVALFATSEETPFTLMHCYIIFQNVPKWQQYHAAKVPSNRKRVIAENFDLSREESELPDNSTVPSSSSRPIGQKASKAGQRNQGCATQAGMEMAKAGNLMASAAKERLIYSKQKAITLCRLANHSIMSTDLEGLGETAREFYTLEKKRILNETRREYANMELEFAGSASGLQDVCQNDDAWICEVVHDEAGDTPEENDGYIYDPYGQSEDLIDNVSDNYF